MTRAAALSAARIVLLMGCSVVGLEHKSACTKTCLSCSGRKVEKEGSAMGALQMPVARNAQIGLRLVSGEALDGAQPRAVLADHSWRLGLDALVGAGLHELTHPQPAGVASCFAGR